MKNKRVLIELFRSAFLVIGAIVLASIAFRYPGVINLELGVDGGRVNIRGTPTEQIQDKLLLIPNIE